MLIVKQFCLMMAASKKMFGGQTGYHPHSRFDMRRLSTSGQARIIRRWKFLMHLFVIVLLKLYKIY